MLFKSFEEMEMDSDSLYLAVAHEFFPRTCCSIHIKHDKREPGLIREEFRCTEMICLCRETYCCFDQSIDKIKFSSKGLNKRTLEKSCDGPLEKYRRELDKKTNVQPTDRDVRTIQHSVWTYEQTKRGLSDFYPKLILHDNGIHTKPLL